ncbi:hypothetical protein DFH09DRAFT_175834 [Mycena vulgaris]|nr:hypothetical protein DFH09DRAFT_175834 [Mycena vulgaris]
MGSMPHSPAGKYWISCASLRTLWNACSTIFPYLIGMVFLRDSLLPSLRHLRFGKVEGEYSNAANIIRYLSLPALELLYLPIFTTDIPYFDLFLRRSSPPLRKLTMASYVWTSGFPQQMVACLCLASSITHFELYSANGMDVAPSLFAALSDTSSFLPTLRSLKLRRFQSRLSDDSYDALFRVLSFRRGQIVCFELRWSAYSNNVSEPNARLLAAFRQLIAEGMEIQIGTEFLNFI